MMASRCLSWAIVLALGLSPACGLSRSKIVLDWERPHATSRAKTSVSINGCNSTWGEYTQQEQPELFDMSVKIRDCVDSIKELYVDELHQYSDDPAQCNGGLKGAGSYFEASHSKPSVSMNLARTSVDALQSLRVGNDGRNIVMVGDSTTRYSWTMLTCALMTANSPSDQSAVVTSADLKRLQCNNTIGIWCLQIRDTGVKVSFVWLQDPEMMAPAMRKLNSIDVPAGSTLVVNYGIGFNGGYLAKNLTTSRTVYKSEVEGIVGPIIAYASNRSSQVLWRETVSQHYGTETGAFPVEWPIEKRREKFGPKCSPYTLHRDRAGFNYRNDVANSVMRSLGVPVISVYPVFCSAWQEHPAHGDCSHLTFNGNIALLDILLQGILRHSGARRRRVGHSVVVS